MPRTTQTLCRRVRGGVRGWVRRQRLPALLFLVLRAARRAGAAVRRTTQPACGAAPHLNVSVACAPGPCLDGLACLGDAPRRRMVCREGPSALRRCVLPAPLL
eukprot:TRINITY_DN1879_c0_g1_i2.p2 TRINITY_DN1879_c0_g1~~TRINITY_DN1879_c0_g1_i2.p2  ORF type:complete len:103 (+),score=2.13 TRINITY_DN1879_c0_g1_i2:125-433(+)